MQPTCSASRPVPCGSGSRPGHSTRSLLTADTRCFPSSSRSREQVPPPVPRNSSAVPRNRGTEEQGRGTTHGTIRGRGRHGASCRSSCGADRRPGRADRGPTRAARPPRRTARPGAPRRRRAAPPAFYPCSDVCATIRSTALTGPSPAPGPSSPPLPPRADHCLCCCTSSIACAIDARTLSPGHRAARSTRPLREGKALPRESSAAGGAQRDRGRSCTVIGTRPFPVSHRDRPTTDPPNR